MTVDLVLYVTVVITLTASFYCLFHVAKVILDIICGEHYEK